MRIADKNALEDALRAHYREDRHAAASPLDRKHQEAVARLVAQAAQAEQRESVQAGSAADFAAAIVKFVPRWMWAVPLAAIALVALTATQDVSSSTTLAILAAAGPTLAAANLYGTARAKSCGMTEMEAACIYGAVAVAGARLALLCSAGVAALLIACSVCSGAVPLFASAAVALAPYLVASAGGLFLARKVAAHDAAFASVAWAAAVLAGCFALNAFCPMAYSQAAVWVWAAVAAGAALWFAREALLWTRNALDALPNANGTCTPEAA